MLNSFTVLKVASDINSMTVDELQVLAECINEKKADALSAFISYVIQDRQIMENQKELV
jgi:hypothetical protein